MPLQPSSYGLLHPLLKSVHVLGQKEPMHQTLGNTTPFAFSHTRTLALIGSGLPSSWNLGCHACAAWEEDTTPVPTWDCGSCMVTPLDGWGVTWVTTSPGPVEVCSTTRGLFWIRTVWGGGGGGGREASDLGPEVAAAAQPAWHRARSS